MSRDFKPGDLIFAKMKGYPHWPARVSPLVPLSRGGGVPSPQLSSSSRRPRAVLSGTCGELCRRVLPPAPCAVPRGEPTSTRAAGPGLAL